MLSPLAIAAKVIGMSMLLLGIALGAWVSFNLFVFETARFAGSAAADSGFKGIILAVVLILVGSGLAFGRKSPGMGEDDAGTLELSRPGTDIGRELDAQLLDDIRVIAQGGKKIEAIKIYREASGVGLADAKRAVEALTREAA